MNRLVYIRDNDTGQYWNVNWEPVCRPAEKFECRQGLGYTILSNTSDGVETGFRVFVPPGSDPVELWDFQIKNCRGTRRNISVFFYVQFQFAFKWGFNSYGDMFYREAHWNRELNAVVASKHPFRRPHDFLTGFLASDRPIAAFDGSRDAFVGGYGTLKEPIAVVRGRCSNTRGSSDATVGAVQFDLVLEQGQEESVSLVLGATDQEGRIASLRERLPGPFRGILRPTGRRQSGHGRRQPSEDPGPALRPDGERLDQAGGPLWQPLVPLGLERLPRHRAARPGRFRPAPGCMRSILLEALRHQFSNGLALRGWNPVDEKPYSDSALWLVFTLCAYLKETGDTALLAEEVPYYDGGLASVLDHVRTTLDFLEHNKGAHGLVLIKFGDWNDSLTGVGKEGRGESVWLSIAYAEALREMAALMRFLARPEAEADYARRREGIVAAINEHAWDGQWYLRCFDDDGRAIGSQQNRFGRIFMEPQSWALIAGIASPERACQLLESCDRLLLTELGYMLLAPPFTELDPNIGRISSMEPGICENGTVYTHVNIWMILGLLRLGMADKACELFHRITPASLSGPEDPKRSASFQYSNCYFGPQHKNRALQQEFTWITGSLAWLNTVLVNELLGAKPDYEGLRVEPCLPSAWEEARIRRTWRGATYNILIRNPQRVEGGAVEITLDGKPLAGAVLPEFRDGKVHEVVATLREPSR